jgi:single-strand DNA-binding protein
MFNKVILVGNLTRDIELKYTPSGMAIAKVGIATNRVYTDPTTKEKKQEVMFIDVVIFGRAAETSHQYLRKGSQVLVEGRLSLNQWIDNSGQKRSKHEIIAENVKFLGGKGGGDYSSPVASTPKENRTSTQQNNESRNSSNIPSIDIDEDMPF